MNTQGTVQDHFSEGGPVLKLALQLLRGEVRHTSIPRIRVAEREGEYYSADNRRLFIYKALYLNKEVTVNLIPWSQEFDCKRAQRKNRPYFTGEGGLHEFRRALLQHLNDISAGNSEVQHVFIPAASFRHVQEEYFPEDFPGGWYRPGYYSSDLGDSQAAHHDEQHIVKTSP